MGCNYWECKYNNLTKKNTIGDCKKPNESNIRQPCPKQNKDFCTEGEMRNADINAVFLVNA